MATMTLTEFNQNVSRATRLARVEDVIITERGQPSFTLCAVNRPPDRLERLIKAGLVRPAQTPLRGKAFRTLDVDSSVARQIIADFESERNDTGY